MILCEDRIVVRYTERRPPSFANTRKQFFGLDKDDETKKSTKETTDDGEEWW